MKRVIPPEYFNTVREKVSWHDILSQLDVKIYRTGGTPCFGADLKMRCIFHKEKTPSLFFCSSKGVYHCMGCGSFGDIFDFLSFYFAGKPPEWQCRDKTKICRWLKKNFNIPLPWEK